MIIGVFDSGVGGKSVANAIRDALPVHEVILTEDKEHIPYGTKTPDRLYGLVLPILKGMVASGCEVIVIACNTVTTTLITRLRTEITVPIIGMEPMVKPAAEHTRSGVIAVCATSTTLSSERYAWLKSEYCKEVAVIEPDCSSWASMVEENKVNHEVIREVITSLLTQKADVIVLGCTHYHWIEAVIADMTEGKARVLQPEEPVISQLTRVLAQFG